MDCNESPGLTSNSQHLTPAWWPYEQLGPTEGIAISLLNLNSPPQPQQPPEESPLPPEQRLDGTALESAPKDAEFHVVMLKELQDDLTRSRVREAFWISVVVHMIVIIALATSPKWMPEPSKKVQMRSAEEMLRDRELTYLAAPPDTQKPPDKVPDAKHLSDKNRIATSRTPQPDRKTLEDLRAGRPKPPGQPQPQGAPQQQPGAQQQQQAVAPQPQSMPTPPPNTNPNALQAPSQPQQRAANRNPFSQQPLTAGSAIAEATRGAARSGGGGSSGDYGTSPIGPRGRVRGAIDVLSDTQGVDFGPYLGRVRETIRQNWYTLVPESAEVFRKRAKVSIEFAILPDGKVAGMRVVGPSGEAPLDRAAWGGITLSNPFPPLPTQFKGPYLALRFHFFYNPEPGDMQ